VLVIAIIALLATGREALAARGTDNVLLPFGTYVALAYLLPLGVEQLAGHLAVILLAAAAVLVLSRLAWNVTASAALSVVGAAYASWLFGDVGGLVPVALSFAWFCALWARHDPTREVYHLPDVVQVFAVPLAVLAAARGAGSSGVPLPFLAALGCGFSLMLHVRWALTERPPTVGAKLRSGARAAGASVALLVAPGLALGGGLAAGPLLSIGLVELFTTGLYVFIHEVRGPSPHFFGRLALLSALAAVLAGACSR
jgi:hypothetical protein